MYVWDENFCTLSRSCRWLFFFNQQTSKPCRYPWNLSGWGYLDINVFVPSHNDSSVVRQLLLSQAACGNTGSIAGCASSVWCWACPRRWRWGNSPPLQALCGPEMNTQKGSVLLASSSDVSCLGELRQAESFIWAHCLLKPRPPVCCLSSEQPTCTRRHPGRQHEIFIIMCLVLKLG